MRTLPLYPDSAPSFGEVELATPLDRDAYPPVGITEKGRACDRCPLGVRPGLRTPCLAADGRSGGLLVVGEAPGADEDGAGMPFIGRSGRLLRAEVKAHWKGPVAYDNAMRCMPGKGSTPAKLKKAVDACRGFLLRTIEEVMPMRILAVGAWAAYSLFGRTVAPYSTRRGYAYLRGQDIDGAPIPVFFLIHPAAALRNRFVSAWFEADVRHALTAPDPPVGPWGAEVRVVDDVDDALGVEAELAPQAWVSFDVETTGEMWTEDFKIISVAVCGEANDNAVVWDRAALADVGMRGVLTRMMASKRVRKVGQNVKYDQLAFRARYGVHVRPIAGDTRLMRKLLEPEADGKLAKMAELVGMGGLKEEAEHGMADLVKRTKAAMRRKTPEKVAAAFEAIGLPAEIESAVRLGDPPERHMYGMLSEETLLRYNARDAVATARLARMLEGQLAGEEALGRTWRTLVLPAAQALERVEGWGIGANRDAIRAFDAYLERREVVCKTQLDQYPGVNWDSPDQVGKLLFETLGLPPIKLTDTGKNSTDKEVLVALSKRHPLPGHLVDYRFVTKLRSNYAGGMMEHVRPDGRIHPNIKLDGARSGRMSCTDPNLQNVPRAQSVEGKMARDCFYAPPGYVLLEADFSQIELRVAAMLSGDEVMTQIFRSGQDYHMRTAQLVSMLAWGIKPEDVGDKHRSLAKNVNFGVLYGKTAKTFAEEWGITVHKAQAIVDAIMGNFRQLQRWMGARHTEASRTGVVWTYWAGEKARRRPLYRVADQDDAAASVARNGAVNSPIQGTASDYLAASLVECVGWIEQDGIEDLVKLCLPVHDSLMFEVREDMVRETALQVHEIMTGWDSGDVPIEADFKVGKSWGSMSKLVVKDGVVAAHTA